MGSEERGLSEGEEKMSNKVFEKQLVQLTSWRSWHLGVTSRTLFIYCCINLIKLSYNSLSIKSS